MSSPSHALWGENTLPPQRILPTSTSKALHDVQTSRDIENRCLASLPPHTLVTRAGQLSARLLMACHPHHRHVWVLAGPGNNGSDGLETAATLKAQGRVVHVTHVPSSVSSSLCEPTQALHSLQQAQIAGVPISHGPPPWANAPDIVIVDALLGIGIRAAPREPILHWIRQANQHPAPVLALDVPSGLDADTGHIHTPGSAVQAQITLSLLTLKPGLFTGLGRDACGDIWYTDLGCTHTVAATPASAWLLGQDTHRHDPLHRQHHQHKGDFGAVTILGGASGMHGAAHLAARAALKVGAGRVYLSTLDTPASHAPSASDSWPEIMTRPLTQAPYAQAGVVTVCGCGGGDEVTAILPQVLAHAPALVLDADALNAISRLPSLREALKARVAQNQATVLTPHPLEAARLLGQATADVQAHRLRSARILADNTGAIVVLKGSGTVIATPGHPSVSVNSTGNPSLATAGTGDVLAGWIAGYWAQGLSPSNAAALAVFQHGQIAEWFTNETPSALALRASDLLHDLVPQAQMDRHPGRNPNHIG